MDQLYRHLHMPAELAIEFMATFSRMEHALKSTGYALGNADNVQANWDAFANQIDTQFIQLQDKELIKAQKLLLSHPPRKQVFENQQVVFKDQIVDQQQRTTQQLLRFVRTVRNNLFHGGKYLPTGENDVGRNEELVRASLNVIRACIALDNNIKQSYEY